MSTKSTIVLNEYISAYQETSEPIVEFGSNVGYYTYIYLSPKVKISCDMAVFKIEINGNEMEIICHDVTNFSIDRDGTEIVVRCYDFGLSKKVEKLHNSLKSLV